MYIACVRDGPVSLLSYQPKEMRSQSVYILCLIMVILLSIAFVLVMYSLLTEINVVVAVTDRVTAGVLCLFVI